MWMSDQGFVLGLKITFENLPVSSRLCPNYVQMVFRQCSSSGWLSLPSRLVKSRDVIPSAVQRDLINLSLRLLYD